MTMILKIKRVVTDNRTAAGVGEPSNSEEIDTFVECREVEAQAWMIDGDDPAGWTDTGTEVRDLRSYELAPGVEVSEIRNDPARVIQVSYADGGQEWFLASQAWLMSERTGRTIERIA